MRGLKRSGERGLMVLVFLACARCAAAQTRDPDPAPRFELWGAVSFALSGPSGVLASSYSPPLLLDGPFISHGGQTLTFDSRAATGLEAGANLFVSPHAGIQFLFHRDAPDMAGMNSPYEVTLEYTSRLPPDNIPRPVTIRQSTPWPDTTGSLTRTGVDVNGVVRMGQPRWVSVTLSGGFTYERLHGTLQPIAFTAFRLGGHSVLFQDDFILAASLEPTNAIGFNGGGDLNIVVHRGVALMAGYRYRGGPTSDMPVRVTTVVNADRIVFEQTIADITRYLALAPARVDLSGSRVVVGLKLMR